MYNVFTSTGEGEPPGRRHILLLPCFFDVISQATFPFKALATNKFMFIDDDEIRIPIIVVKYVTIYYIILCKNIILLYVLKRIFIYLSYYY